MTAAQKGWLGASAPIALWLIHLMMLASLSRWICDNPGWRWVPHAATGVLLALCVPCLVMLVDLTRRVPATEADAGGAEASSPPDPQLRFIGMLGLLLGASSVLLILAEEIFAVVIEPCL